MAAPFPKVYTIAPGNDPLAVLASAVLGGLPFQQDAAALPPLHQWTIFLPTRRAVRRLQLHFRKLASKSVLLPHIRPIDDIDEDVVQLDSAHDLLPALSQEAELFFLTSLVLEWVRDNPHRDLASDIGQSRLRAHGLAENLSQLISRIETEELKFEFISAAYDLRELALHRDAILSLLTLVKDHYPAMLQKTGHLGRGARRNEVIRLQAQHIASGHFSGPVIAAGSTGSNPATRQLLKAIAWHPQGAVVLPGLDLAMDDADWISLEPTHPQYGLAQLVGELEVTRDEVHELGVQDRPRQWLVRELMRPTDSTEKWKDIVGPTQHKKMHDAMEGVSLIEAENRHVEARVIALALRQALETEGQTAALITPDRDLAQRVKAEMLRWSITIDDSAGEPLTRFGIASLCQILGDTVATGFAASSLIKLMHHELVTLDGGREDVAQAFRHIELAAFRQQGFEGGLQNVLHAVDRASLESRTENARPHLTVERLSTDDWSRLINVAERLTHALAPLANTERMAFSNILQTVREVLKRLAPEADMNLPENVAFEMAWHALQAAGALAPDMDFHEAFSIIVQQLRKISHRPLRAEVHPRLAILGLAEARMMMPDLVVMGGLNEGKWPEQPDPGPWLNRGMRETIKMSQPERAIGLTAHDFVETFAKPKVIVTWSKRDQKQPLIRSRWVLRLNMLTEGMHDIPAKEETHLLLQLARSMSHVRARLAPLPKPRPKPPVTARPKRYSVTDIVKLNRDPYHIYARKVLRLEPIEKLGAEADARLRGILFHEAIAQWNMAPAQARTEQHLIAEGKKVLSPLAHDPAVQLFWSSRLARIAHWLAKEELLRVDALRVAAEPHAKLDFSVGGADFVLSGYADRIDVLPNNGARIIDYKTSSSATPSVDSVMAGWEPQLTLEAYLLSKGAFQGLPALSARELAYVKVTGAAVPGEYVQIKSKKEPLSKVVQQHFEGLCEKLASMTQLETAFVPRAYMQNEDDTSDYDHLSRFREWGLKDGDGEEG